MDNMRKHILSSRKSSSRLNISVFCKRPYNSAIEYVTDRFLTVNEANAQRISGGSGSATAINDAIRSAAQHSSTISLDAIPREALVSQIIDICRTIRGAKILTVCRDHDASFTIHINENNNIGHNTSDTKMLRSELSLAFQYGGTVIIRQFLPFKTQQLTPNVEKHWVPWKNVYAFNLGNDMFEAVPKAHLNYANSIGPDGKPISKEQGVMFCEYCIPVQKQTDIPEFKSMALTIPTMCQSTSDLIFT